MSETKPSIPLRIGLIVEGRTDGIVLQAAIKSLLPDRDLEFTHIQPDFSVAFGGTGEGWSGVYHWCRQAAREGGGSVSGTMALLNHDVFVIHLDADVAEKTYQSGRIDETATDLPCVRKCPPASDTTDALRQVVLRWMSETKLPAKFVFCTPSKSIEAWVIKALYPKNTHAQSKGWECHTYPEKQLGQQPKAIRIGKTEKDYESHRQDIIKAWPDVRKLDEAERFSQEFLTVFIN